MECVVNIVEGESTFKELKPDGYYSNFAWNSPSHRTPSIPKKVENPVGDSKRIEDKNFQGKTIHRVA